MSTAVTRRAVRRAAVCRARTRVRAVTRPRRGTFGAFWCPMTRHRLFCTLLVTAAACGGTTAGITGPEDAATEHDTSDASSSGDGGCLLAEPTEGSACTPGQTVCDRGVDMCCRGYAWLCDPSQHVWRKEGVGCACKVDGVDAGPFACGDKTCAADEYCTMAGGGAHLPDAGSNVTYSCTKIPAACEPAPSCPCLVANASTCGGCGETDGHLKITCLYP
jgi:hypothetical protein